MRQKWKLRFCVKSRVTNNSPAAISVRGVAMLGKPMRRALRKSSWHWSAAMRVNAPARFPWVFLNAMLYGSSLIIIIKI